MFFNLRSAKKSLQWLNEQEAHAVAEDLGVAVKDVREMEMRLAVRDPAFDASADDDDEGAPVAPVYYLEDRAADPARIVENNQFNADNSSRLGVAVASLDDRSRDIIQRRWLGDTKSTLHDLAREYGVSAERIRQLEKNAMNRVRGLMQAE